MRLISFASTLPRSSFSFPPDICHFSSPSAALFALLLPLRFSTATSLCFASQQSLFSVCSLCFISLQPSLFTSSLLPVTWLYCLPPICLAPIPPLSVLLIFTTSFFWLFWLLRFSTISSFCLASFFNTITSLCLCTSIFKFCTFSVWVLIYCRLSYFIVFRSFIVVNAL